MMKFHGLHLTKPGVTSHSLYWLSDRVRKFTLSPQCNMSLPLSIFGQ